MDGADLIHRTSLQDQVSAYGGQTVSLVLFRFRTRDRVWALAQMGLAHASMKTEGLSFYKLVGCGSGIGYDPRPDWDRYGILSVWETGQQALSALDAHPVHARWRERSTGYDRFLLKPTRARGTWSGRAPFTVPPLAQRSAPVHSPDAPLAILTRASLKLRKVRQFWRQVPAISRALEGAEGVTFTAGIGEIPWLHQVTFSLWSSERALNAFAHEDGHHARAATAAFSDHWFDESLFARFSLLEREHTLY